MRQKAVLVAFAAGASASLFHGGLSGFEFNNAADMCDKTLQDANATGVFSYNPHVAQFHQKGQTDNDSGFTLPVEVAVTVQEISGVQNASVQWSIWYGTNGANYSYDFALGYDVCAFALETPSVDMFLRAQDDNGDCKTAMDETCVADLQEQAGRHAYELIIDPTTLEPWANNLTRDSVYDVCGQVRKNLQDNFPKSCEVFMNHTDPPRVTGGALTGYNYSYLYDGCTITNSTSEDVYHHVATFTKYTLDNSVIAKQYYTGLNIFAQPLMLLFMPVANSNAPATISTTVPKMQCVRTTRTAPGSEKIVNVPAPTPLHAGEGLSGGAIAGIVVGVVTGVALIGAAAWLFWRRRKRSLATKIPHDEKDNLPSYAAKEQEAHMVAGDEQQHMAEAGGAPLAELNSQDARQRAELPIKEPPAELVGDVPHNPK